MIKRRTTKQIRIGQVPMGSDYPIAVQSMLNAPAEDFEKNYRQLCELQHAGCEIARMSVPNNASLKVFEKLCKKSILPLVADIHYRSDLAISAIKVGASKVRINPGNLGGLNKTDKIINTAKFAGIPIRIGINAGSLDEKFKQRTDIDLAEKMYLSVKEYVEYFKSHNFDDIVVSAKAHDVLTCVKVNRLIANNISDVLIHLGVTEAGSLLQGSIKSASALGILLSEGIGDTIRISLTDNPLRELEACWFLLSALGLRRKYAEIISCPTCGRTKVDLISLVKDVENKIKGKKIPLKIAVMGCIVNGPGEASDADIGVACEAGRGAIFVKGKIVKKVSDDKIVDELLKEINNLLDI